MSDLGVVNLDMLNMRMVDMRVKVAGLIELEGLV